MCACTGREARARPLSKAIDQRASRGGCWRPFAGVAGALHRATARRSAQNTTQPPSLAQLHRTLVLSSAFAPSFLPSTRAAQTRACGEEERHSSIFKTQNAESPSLECGGSTAAAAAAAEAREDARALARRRSTEEEWRRSAPSRTRKSGGLCRPRANWTPRCAAPCAASCSARP